MKQIKTTSKSKYMIMLNLFLILALMTASVYAWFASQVDNHVDAYEITVESDNALELSFDGVTWGGSLNLADYKVNGTSVMSSLKMVEVTSDGNTFRIPQLTQKTNYALVNTSAQFSNAVANQSYLDFTVQLRSKDKLSVYLSSESKAEPVTPSDKLTGETCGNPSTYASGANAFSKDCIVGALRVGYTDNSGTNQIWITNPEFHLNNKIGSADYSMTINANATYSDGSSNSTEGYDFYWNDPKVHYYYNGKVCTKNTSAITEIPDSVNGQPTGTKTLIAQLSGTPNEKGYFTDSVTFRVWIEGCDTEARRALVGGQFNLSLVFDTFGIS